MSRRTAAALYDVAERLHVGEPCRNASTSVSRAADEHMRLVEAVERLTGRPVIRNEKAGAAIEAPGMLASHYAPDAPVRLEARDVRPGEVLIRFGGAALPGEKDAALVLDLSPAGDLAEAAANLFGYMKRADALGAASIAFSPIPAVGLGEAINDRLQRAAAPRG